MSAQIDVFMEKSGIKDVNRYIKIDEIGLIRSDFKRVYCINMLILLALTFSEHENSNFVVTIPFYSDFPKNQVLS